MNRSRIMTVSLSAMSGAGVALILDPRSGARRRGLLRDKAGHYARVAGQRLRRLRRRLPGPVRGAVHAAVARAPWYTPVPPPDQDEYIKHRVESTLGRERDLPLSGLNFDAADGVVRVRGSVPDAGAADRVVRRVMSVDGVRAVLTYLRTPDAQSIERAAGDERLLRRPRAARQRDELRQQIMSRWPAVNDDDIVASNGHLERMAARVALKSGRPASEVRPILDSMLLQSALQAAAPAPALSSRAPR